MCTLLLQGWLKTDMGQQNARFFGVEPTMSAEQSASGIMRVIEGLSPDQNGQFLTHDKGLIDW